MRKVQQIKFTRKLQVMLVIAVLRVKIFVNSENKLCAILILKKQFLLDSQISHLYALFGLAKKLD